MTDFDGVADRHQRAAVDPLFEVTAIARFQSVRQADSFVQNGKIVDVIVSGKYKFGTAPFEQSVKHSAVDFGATNVLAQRTEYAVRRIFAAQ